MNVLVNQLTKVFGRNRALDRISFMLESGHIYGFVGPNGAGKTTTLRILATLEEPSEGDATIGGYSIRNEPDRTCEITGFVPDTLPTHYDITVHEYIDFFARAYGLRGRALDAAVERIEEFTGLVPLRDKLLKELSKGMQQRVSVGRALVHDPHILLMDEPAAGLDPRARIELRELLSILADQRKTILISSHILTELTEICTGVVIIEQGRILETGTLDKVLQRAIPRRTLVIRALGQDEALGRELMQYPGIAQVRSVAGAWEVDVTMPEERIGELLAELDRKGHRIVEFRQQQSDLEDIFMLITQGNVQ